MPGRVARMVRMCRICYTNPSPVTWSELNLLIFAGIRFRANPSRIAVLRRNARPPSNGDFLISSLFSSNSTLISPRCGFEPPLSTPKVELRKSEVLIRKSELLGGRALRFFSQSVNMSLQLQVVAENRGFNSDRVDFHGARLAQFPMPPDRPKYSFGHRMVPGGARMNGRMHKTAL